MFRLRKPRMENLLQKYLQLQRETEIHRKALENIPTEDTETRQKMVGDLLKLFVKTNIAQLQVIERFSPIVAKELKFKLENYEKTTLESFSKDYLNTPEIRHLPENMRKNMIKNLTNNSVDSSLLFMDLVGQMNGLVFSACLETMNRTSGRPPEELDEYISRLVLKHFPEYVKPYKGAWQALESDNLDRFRHCSASMRKIVDGILGKGSLNRKEALKSFSIFGAEADLIDALAETVNKIYVTLNKGIHGEIRHKTALLSIRITEHILRYLLEEKEKN